MRRALLLLLLLVPGLVTAQGWTPPPARKRGRPAPAAEALAGAEEPEVKGPVQPPPPPLDPSRPTKVVFSYLHHLATWTGELRTSWPRLAYDQWNHEVVLVEAGKVRFFVPSGMEVFRLNDGGGLGQVVAAAPLQDGSLVLLAKNEERILLLRTDYRGEVMGEVALKGIPWTGEGAFSPSNLISRDGLLYVVDESTLRLVVVTPEGEVRRSLELRGLVGEDAKSGDFDIRGLSVDSRGNLLFTIPSRFRVHLLEPGGEMKAFGQKGDKLGRFNVVVGAAADEDGVVFTSDVLKGMVQAFDRDFNFVGALPGEVSREARLGTIGDILVAEGRLYVTQGGKRGVAVFAISKE